MGLSKLIKLSGMYSSIFSIDLDLLNWFRETTLLSCDINCIYQVFYTHIHCKHSISTLFSFDKVMFVLSELGYFTGVDSTKLFMLVNAIVFAIKLGHFIEHMICCMCNKRTQV